MANLEIAAAYKEKYGQSIPFYYFGDEARAIEIAKQGLERGSPYSEREWLGFSSFENDEIDQILNGDIVI